MGDQALKQRHAAILAADVTGHSALLAPAGGGEVDEGADRHPDERLALPPSAELGRLRAAAVEAELAARPVDAFWIGTLIVVFFAIHAGRLQSAWTWLGLISPLVAVIGDVLLALLVAVLLLLPVRLGWRRLTPAVTAAARALQGIAALLLLGADVYTAWWWRLETGPRGRAPAAILDRGPSLQIDRTGGPGGSSGRVVSFQSLGGRA